MRSCMLALTWLAAVLLLSLQQRGGSVRAISSSSTLQQMPPRVARAVDSPRYVRSRSGANNAARPVENLVLLDEIESAAAAVDEDKRQFDDYGHMRFGKRQRMQQRAFDDYGHMRFGRAGTD